MGFLGIIERAGEPVAERRLERGKLRGRQAPMAAGHAGEAVELGAVAMERHDQRAVGDGVGIGLAPQRDAALAQVPDDGLGAFLLAARREHGAGIGTAGVGKRLRRALIERDVVTGARQGQRLPQADNAGASDRNRLLAVGHVRDRDSASAGSAV